MTRTFSVSGSCALVLLCSIARAADDANAGTPAKTASDLAQAPEQAPARPARPAIDAHVSMDFAGPSYRSPGIAVALSLTPVPVDFGNLYVENIPWGIAYTTAEVALVTPMMWMLGSHMHEGSGGDRWSSDERGWEIGLVSGYVLVKIASGIHAGYAAADFNRAHERSAQSVLPTVAVARGGALFAAAGSF